LSSYIAASARLRRVSASLSSPEKSCTPTLAEHGCCTPAMA
jgi:hypothetical protein